MLIKTELDRRFGNEALELNGDLFPAHAKVDADHHRRARRLNRHRRESSLSYRRPHGWSVGLW